MKTNYTIPIVAALIMCLVIPLGSVVAQEEAVSTEGAGGTDSTAYEANTPDFAEGAAKANKFSITLDEVPLDDVVKMFTKIAPDANIIVSATNLFDKSVTVNLKDVEWKPALSSILKTHNLALSEESSGVYTIVEKSADAAPPMMTRSFKLNYTTCGDIAPVVQAMLPIEPAGSTVTQFAQRNIMVVRSTADVLTAIEAIIKEIDQPSAQVAIETKFMELNDTASKQLGIEWTSLEEFGVGLSMAGIRTEEVNKSLTRDDTMSQWDNRQNTDTVAKEYDINNTPILGADPIRVTQDSIDKGKNVGSDIVDSFARNIVEQQTAILEMSDMVAIMSALERSDGVSIISNPKIIVTSGYTNAIFRVGTDEPLIRTEITRGTADSPGDIVTASLDTSINTEAIKGGFVRTGIELRVIPNVKTGDMIEAQIDPRLTRKVGDKFVGANSWPVMSVKQISTKFTLKSGQTVAIGGLTDTQEEDRVSKIPLLGNIPLIGKYLFSHSKTVKSQVETIIFVTLNLAEPQDLHENAGIPEDAHLVHSKRIEQKARRNQNQMQLEKEREAAEAKMEMDAMRVKSRLLRRDK